MRWRAGGQCARGPDDAGVEHGIGGERVVQRVESCQRRVAAAVSGGGARQHGRVYELWRWERLKETADPGMARSAVGGLGACSLGARQPGRPRRVQAGRVRMAISDACSPPSCWPEVEDEPDLWGPHVSEWMKRSSGGLEKRCHAG